jgi:NAD(P)H-hydrate repair Nnr-like enzyme with NAD(P)H-hydrate dehydratase domain
MNQTYWQKQLEDKPLYPDLIWSRPENKAQAGKLLIVGGHAQSFAAVAQAYGIALQTGIGTSRVMLPDALKKTVSSLFVGAEYAASTPSGSFARGSLASILDNALWSDAVLLAGDFGRNSETAIVLERLVETYKGKLCLTKDSVDYFSKLAPKLFSREDTMLVLSLSQLQALSISARFPKAFTLGMGLVRLVETLHELTEQCEATILVKHLDNLVAAYKGQVITTKLSTERSIWRVEAAAKACVWWLQNPTKPLESIATSIVSIEAENI